MEDDVVVVLLLCVDGEVFHGFRGVLWEEADGDVAHTGVDGGGCGHAGVLLGRIW